MHEPGDPAPFPLMKKLLLLGIVGSLTAHRVGAQQLAGTITDARTGHGLPFVNIGVVGKSLGTVSDEQGAYHLGFSEALAADTVRVSSLGYQPLRLPLRELRAQPSRTLAPAAVGLAEVQVQASNPLRRTRTLGYTKSKGASTVNFSSLKDYGAELGTRIQLRHRPTLVQSVTFNLAHNQAGKLTFRVNLYRLGANGQPTNVKLLTRDVLVTTDLAEGPVTVDLTADHLVLNEDFLLALEWVRGSDAQHLRESLAFAGGVGYADNDVYIRATSQAAWEPISMGALLAGMQFKVAFFATVKE